MTSSRLAALRIACSVTIPVVVLLAAAIPLLDAGPLGLSDHPYRAFQLGFARDSLASLSDPLGVEPRIWGGYPELQHYPPGFALLGALIGIGAGVADDQAYRLLVIFVYLLPAASTALLLAVGARTRVETAVTGGILAGFAAFGMSGTVAGVGYGTVASRLSYGVAPVVVLAALVAVRHDGRRWKTVASVAVVAGSLAALMLAHPYRVPATLAVVVALVALPGGPPVRIAFIRVGLPLAGGILVAGWWWAGLFLVKGMSVPFLWGRLSLSNLTNPNHSEGLDWLLVVAAAAVVVALRWRRGFEWPWRMVWAVPVSAASLGAAALAGVESLDPFRLFDDLYLWTMVAAALVLELGPQRLRLVRGMAAAAACSTWLVLGLQALDPASMFATTVPGLEAQGPAALLDELADGSGTVLFVNSTYGQGLSHLLGGQTAASGRRVLGGTSTHPSPLQSVLMYGRPDATVRNFANDFDDESLFGIPWVLVASSDAAARSLADSLASLGVSQIVAEVYEPARAVGALDARPELFERVSQHGPLVLFDVVQRRGARFATSLDGATLTATSEGFDRGSYQVASDRPSSVLLHVGSGPYWEVRVDGRAVATAEDRYGQPVVRVPAGAHRVEYRHRIPPQLQRARSALVILGLAVLVVAVRLSRMSGPGRNSADDQ